jgi:LEA14-like dessication related protein
MKREESIIHSLQESTVHSRQSTADCLRLASVDVKRNLPWTVDRGLWTRITLIILSSLILSNCSTPKERIVLRDIKDVIVDAADEPTLRANAVFYNPNNTRMRLKKIDVEVFVEGKKVANVNQDLKTIIPARGEFMVPLQVKLAMKELGFVNTLFGMLGGKKLEVQYKGFLKLTYHGVPIRVPVDYKDQIRFKF